MWKTLNLPYNAETAALAYLYQSKQPCATHKEPRMGNQEITTEELAHIRAMADFDLTMLISEIHDHGWTVARVLIPMIVDANRKKQ